MQQTEKSVCTRDCKERAFAHLFCTTLVTGVCGVSDHAWGLPPTREYLSARETNCSKTAVVADYEKFESELMWLTFPANLRKGLATLFCCRSVMRLTNLKHNHTCFSSKVKFDLICMVQVHLMNDKHTEPAPCHTAALDHWPPADLCCPAPDNGPGLLCCPQPLECFVQTCGDRQHIRDNAPVQTFPNELVQTFSKWGAGSLVGHKKELRTWAKNSIK